MQNQHHNQQQKLQLQQGSQFSPTLPQPEINYGRNMKNSCDCSKMGKDERDPERCAFCKNDHYNISNGNLELLYTFVFVLYNSRNNVIFISNVPSICKYIFEWIF